MKELPDPKLAFRHRRKLL